MEPLKQKRIYKKQPEQDITSQRNVVGSRTPKQSKNDSTDTPMQGESVDTPRYSELCLKHNREICSFCWTCCKLVCTARKRSTHGGHKIEDISTAITNIRDHLKTLGKKIHELQKESSSFRMATRCYYMGKIENFLVQLKRFAWQTTLPNSVRFHFITQKALVKDKDGKELEKLLPNLHNKMDKLKSPNESDCFLRTVTTTSSLGKRKANSRGEAKCDGSAQDKRPKTASKLATSPPVSSCLNIVLGAASRTDPSRPQTGDGTSRPQTGGRTLRKTPDSISGLNKQRLERASSIASPIRPTAPIPASSSTSVGSDRPYNASLRTAALFTPDYIRLGPKSPVANDNHDRRGLPVTSASSIRTPERSQATVASGRPEAKKSRYFIVENTVLGLCTNNDKKCVAVRIKPEHNTKKTRARGQSGAILIYSYSGAFLNVRYGGMYGQLSRPHVTQETRGICYDDYRNTYVCPVTRGRQHFSALAADGPGVHFLNPMNDRYRYKFVHIVYHTNKDCYILGQERMCPQIVIINAGNCDVIHELRVFNGFDTRLLHGLQGIGIQGREVAFLAAVTEELPAAPYLHVRRRHDDTTTCNTEWRCQVNSINSSVLLLPQGDLVVADGAQVVLHRKPREGEQNTDVLIEYKTKRTNVGIAHDKKNDILLLGRQFKLEGKVHSEISIYELKNVK